MSENLNVLQWPDHEWAGDDEGHSCAGCEGASIWRCDRVAHGLGETDRGLKLLNAINDLDPS